MEHGSTIDRAHLNTRCLGLSSWALLVGIMVGFVSATIEGHRAADYSKPLRFQRFHQRISPDALFYPPYAMLQSLALSRWSPGQTLVIIGGNSIMNGVGQPLDVLWSIRLQERLGPAFHVVNLAFRSGYPAHAGALVAEHLIRQGYPVVYVTNTNPTAGAGVSAKPPYGYLYWQARAQGEVAPYGPRDAAVQSWLASLDQAQRHEVMEERISASLEAWTRHQSLWHHIAYRHFFSVWSPLMAHRFWQPRATVPDFEPPAPPLHERYKAPLEYEMNMVRGYSYMSGVHTNDGTWAFSESAAQNLREEINAAFPSLIRPHMLVLLDENSPYYRDQLAADEQARNDAVYAGCAAIWEAMGIKCIVTGRGFTAMDYIDRSHLSGDGGEKLASLVASQIQTITPHE